MILSRSCWLFFFFFISSSSLSSLFPELQQDDNSFTVDPLPLLLTGAGTPLRSGGNLRGHCCLGKPLIAWRFRKKEKEKKSKFYSHVPPAQRHATLLSHSRGCYARAGRRRNEEEEAPTLPGITLPDINANGTLRLPRGAYKRCRRLRPQERQRTEVKTKAGDDAAAITVAQRQLPILLLRRRQQATESQRGGYLPLQPELSLCLLWNFKAYADEIPFTIGDDTTPTDSSASEKTSGKLHPPAPAPLCGRGSPIISLSQTREREKLPSLFRELSYQVRGLSIWIRGSRVNKSVGCGLAGCGLQDGGLVNGSVLKRVSWLTG